MSTLRIALANLRFPASPVESVTLAERAIADAGAAGADIICFPECYVPGYRAPGKNVPPPDQAFLERAWASVASAAGKAGVAVVLGTERVTADRNVRISALVVGTNGTMLGFQDKVQLDISEEATYARGQDRRVFKAAGVTFGVVICHEGWRYPETVRLAATNRAQIIFHPHFHEAEPGSYQPTTFADPQNTFHEKALLCRAAENTVFVASANCASAGSPTTSAIIRPDGTVQAYQPYGEEGLLIADIDLDEATGFLASRLKTHV